MIETMENFAIYNKIKKLNEHKYITQLNRKLNMSKIKYKWFVCYSFMENLNDDRFSMGSCFIKSHKNTISEAGIKEIQNIIKVREHFHEVSIINLILLDND